MITYGWDYFQKGIVLIPKQENPFEYYGHKSIYYNPIGQGCIMSIFQDSNDHLWIGADNEGVYELDAEGKRLRHYQPGKFCSFCSWYDNVYL